MKLTNNGNIPISLAVWLATDNYDHTDDPSIISATSLIKPIRETVLARQNKDLEIVGDVASFIPSQMGTAYHDGIERAWNGGMLYETLRSLGYPEQVCERIVVNPDPNNLPPNCIPVYMEKRSIKTVGNYKVSGKFDFVIEGDLEDFKSTSVWTWVFGGNDQDYILQGSIYRWLNPDIITGESLNIRFIFTDWSASSARQDPKKYPANRVMSKSYPLMSIPETGKYVHERLTLIDSLMGATQEQLPLCTPEELWQKPTIYKYYKDPTKKTKSTKNFTDLSEANVRWDADGRIGVVDTFPGQVVKCQYCKVAGICDQARGYVNDGLLVL